MLHRVRMTFQVWIHNLFWNGTFYFLHFQEQSHNVFRKKDLNVVQITLARMTKRDQREDNFLLIRCAYCEPLQRWIGRGALGTRGQSNKEFF